MTVWIESPFDSLPVEGYRKQRYWLMAEAFVRAGHHVVYWTSDFSHANKRKREEAKAIGGGEGGRVPLVFIPTRPYPKNICLARIRSHREYALEWERRAYAAVADGTCARPDLIVISSPPVATGAVARRLARAFGARLVVDVQDAWPETFYRLLPHGFRWLAWLLLWKMRRDVGATYRAADLVTGVCDRYEALVRGYGARDYYRAYLGIEKAKARGEGEGGRGGIRLAYVGNLGTSYDLKTVLAGVDVLKRKGVSVSLDIAGFGGKVAESDAVRFHGMLDREALGRLLAQCDVGVIPMNADSFVGLPNKLAEYAAAGLRIVSSLGGETEALLAKYECGRTYRPGDVDGFVAAVEGVGKLPAGASARMVAEELLAERIYDGYCARVCALAEGGKA